MGRSALGRVFAFVLVNGKDDLNELLVANGLARVYGTRTAIPDGLDSRFNLDHLAEGGGRGKLGKREAWRFTRTEFSSPKRGKNVQDRV